MDRPAKIEDIPVWMKLLADLPGKKLLGPDKHFDQLIINEYFPGQGIAPHVDHPQQFGDVIFCICLNAGIGIDFSYPDGRKITKWMPAGSAYAMTGDARRVWRHGIEAKKTDMVDGKRVPRGVRYSLTYRTVIQYPRIYPPS
jgi:alkylated DNA repair dioxygenase AlkB